MEVGNEKRHLDGGAFKKKCTHETDRFSFMLILLLTAVKYYAQTGRQNQ